MPFAAFKGAQRIGKTVIDVMFVNVAALPGQDSETAPSGDRMTVVSLDNRKT